MADNKKEKYFYALGRRKTSTATVRLFETEGESILNGKKLRTVYPDKTSEVRLNRLFETAGLDPKNFMMTIVTVGGGVSSQFEAMLLGLARAIVKMDETKKPLLKKEGYMTRDPRMVERKKPGKRKARKSEQFSKR